MTRARREARRPLFISVSWSSPFTAFDRARPRDSDWQLSGARRIRHHLRQAWHIHRAADDVLLITGAMEVYFLCAFSLLRFRRRIVVYDFLRPRARWALILGRMLLWRVDRWLVVRSSDIGMLSARFRVKPESCAFVPFPGRPSTTPAHLGDDIYAAGIAHRDWETLVEAARLVEVPFVVSSQPQLTGVPSNVDARALVSPDEGRSLSAGARLVVVPLVDTELPSGPLVVVDAQANGKAVIASDVGGTRDYITHGQTGWLVPPADPDALAAMIAEVYADRDLLAEVGARARESVRGLDECWEILVAMAEASVRE